MTSVPQRSLPESLKGHPRWSLGSAPWQVIPTRSGARVRVIIDNDFSGDPDDLFQLVHHVLSPSVSVPLVVASHLRPGDPFDSGPDTAANAAAVVLDLFDRMGLDSTQVVVAGSTSALTDIGTPQHSDAATEIVREAMRDDPMPLFYLAGGGLTDLASAILIEPKVAERLTLVWIGGNEHPDLAAPPAGAMPIEYNLLIDVLAAQVLFNQSDLPIWQIPRDVYRQCLVSDAELRIRVATAGAVGRYLYDEVALVLDASSDRGRAETYALGDSPLVLLTALQSVFEPDSSSSRHVVRPTPALESDGSYRSRPDARSMRIYRWIDTRLMFEDFYLKLAEFSRWTRDDDRPHAPQ